jgi:hypothetical protein
VYHCAVPRSSRLGITLILFLVRPAAAEVPRETPRPDGAEQVAKVLTELAPRCDRGEAESCIQIGGLASAEYTVLKSGYHHVQDLGLAQRAYRRAAALLEETCVAGDGQSCDRIAGLYFRPGMFDATRRLAYLEKGCAAGYAPSCLDRAGAIWRERPREAASWYAVACRLKEREGCGRLPMAVLSALFDLGAATKLERTSLRAILLESARPDDRPQLIQERNLALAVARLWAGDPTGALDEIAAADAKVTADQARLHVFAAYAELVAADGIDKPRALRAWHRLVELVPRRGDKYEVRQIRSDYAWTDPTAMMAGAERIAARNR